MPKQVAWNISQMLEWILSYLEQHGDESPLISARWILSEVTGLSFMQLYTNFDRCLNEEELAKIHDYVNKRAKGMPLQYIVGKTSFRFIDLKTRPGVLIPRPETEVLVSEVLSRLPRERHLSDSIAPKKDILVCDLCTGSGCIAASLAFENPKIEVIATDISSECISLAKENIDALELSDSVKIVECDLGSGIDGSLIGSFDAIVSNPPYIPSSRIGELPDEVGEFEPRLALDGGYDGLDVFRRIVSWSENALKAGGFIACELHEDTLDIASDIAKDANFRDIVIGKDLNGLPRILIASKG